MIVNQLFYYFLSWCQLPTPSLSSSRHPMDYEIHSPAVPNNNNFYPARKFYVSLCKRRDLLGTDKYWLRQSGGIKRKKLPNARKFILGEQSIWLSGETTVYVFLTKNFRVLFCKKERYLWETVIDYNNEEWLEKKK